MTNTKQVLDTPNHAATYGVRLDECRALLRHLERQLERHQCLAHSAPEEAGQDLVEVRSLLNTASGFLGWR